MKAAWIGLLLGTLAAPAISAGPAPTPTPRHLLVQVRDTPPSGPAAVRHGADGSYTVSTGGGGERDERGAQAPDNGTTLSTSNRVRRVHIVEGQRVRLDLPSVQSLQFHVPIPPNGAGAAKGATGAATGTGAAKATTGAATGTGAAPATGNIAGPSVSGVVYFDAVAAFAARFALAGDTVRIELTPLRSGAVAAPYAASAAGEAADHAVTVVGRVGEWIALGDTDLQDPAANLSATAEPTRPASVWVRVDPEAGATVP
jgi:hypothetical protein